MVLPIREKVTEKNLPLLMGILNVTPDSFSDGGKYLQIDKALKHAEKLIKDGADIIDVGGESTRPGAARISEEEELDRILPVISAIKENFDILVSVDTYKSQVARLAVSETKADMINDISALSFSPDMAQVAAQLDVPVVLMHIKGTPETMQLNPYYDDVIAEIIDFFEERIAFALSNKIKKENLIIDVGIGFGKRYQDNIRLLQELNSFKQFDLPLLIGVSRKTFIGIFSGIQTPAERDFESALISAFAFLRGADILRVHNIEYTRRALQTLNVLTAQKRSLI